MSNPDYCIIDDSETPAITPEWIKAALLPLAVKNYQDSCDCGEGWMDVSEWIEALENDLFKVLENKRKRQAPLAIELLVTHDQRRDTNREGAKPRP